MNCVKCNVSVDERPLQRVNPPGEIGIWWCENCIKIHEPELYKNIQEDKSNIEKDLESIFYPKP